jgi:beta-glucosidase
MAEEGIILLKNNGRTLPLSKDTGSIAVIGPNAHSPYNQLGDYTSPQPEGQIVTVLEGIRRQLGHERVHYAPGCRIKDGSREGFPRALEAAAQADATVLVIGGSSSRDFGGGTIDLRTGASLVTDHVWSDMDCGEGIDRSTLHLLGVQLELARELRKLGKPLIVVYINGRPVTEPWIDEQADAIVEAWYPGQEGGNAIAAILFGEVNPSGRLPLTLPKHVGQLPLNYNSRRTRGKRYLESDLLPQYPFGFGLSYTEFQYSGLRIEPEAIGPEEEALVHVEVSNTGDAAGSEVVQLYVSDLAASVTRPELALKGFSKIRLLPGESRTVTFPLNREHLELVGMDLRRVVEPGEFVVRVGSHSAATVSCSLTVRESGVQ